MESFTLQGDGFRIGAPNEDQFTVIKSMRPAPLLQLLTKSELDYSAAAWKHGQTELFNAQAAVLVNLLFFGANTGNPARFGSYLEAVQHGLPPEKAFVAGFGLSLAEAQSSLDRHVHAPRWNVLTYPLNRQKTDPNAWPVVPLTGEAVDRRLASVLISTGRIELAMTFLRPVLAAHPADVEALELKADALMSDNYADPPPAAVAALVQAYRAGSRHPWICCLLGYVASGRALTELTDETTGQPVTALAFFQLALAADPQFTPAYLGLAGLFLSRNALTPAERGMLAEAQRLLPASPTVLMALAHVDLLDDKPAQARQRLEDYFQAQPDLPVNVRLQLKQMSAELPEK
jgi:tetratricopeptide (TPR) repeat protein